MYVCGLKIRDVIPERDNENQNGKYDDAERYHEPLALLHHGSFIGNSALLSLVDVFLRIENRQLIPSFFTASFTSKYTADSTVRFVIKVTYNSTSLNYYDFINSATGLLDCLLLSHSRTLIIVERD